MRSLRAGLARLIAGWLRVPMALRLVGPVAAMLLLWYLSSLSSASSSSTMRVLLNNGAHVVAYAGLAGAWLLALLPRHRASDGRVPRWVGIWAIGLSVAYGIVDEVHQSFVPGRVPSFWDVFSDACGSVLAVVVLLWIFSGERRFAVRIAVILLVATAGVAAGNWLPG